MLRKYVDGADSANPEQSLVFVPDQEPETAQQNRSQHSYNNRGVQATND